MICHYRYVFPELKKRGLWGIFYIPTGVYTQQKLLDVHRIHVLLASRDEKKVYDCLQEYISEDMLIDQKYAAFSQETYTKQKNGEYANLVKRILNYYIDYQFREKIIDRLIDEFDINHLCQVADFYVNTDQLREMAGNEMVIGSHSVSHPVLSKLPTSLQLREIQDSFDWLSPFFSIEWKTFCYPYGGKHVYTDETINLLNQENCLFSFDVCSRDISYQDIASPQTLPRYDCNEFPFGQVRTR